MLSRHLLIFIFLSAVFGSVSCEYEPPPPQKSETVWKRVGTWSGRGNQQLETFPIERFTWRVQWETKNEDPPGTGRFHVTANSGDSGRIMAEIADAKGVGHDVTYVTEAVPHRYYFVVTSSGVDWTLTAEEPIE